MNICIFLDSGRTFSFKNIRIIANNESVLVFDYIAMSDSKPKVATFQKAVIAGWSTHQQ